MNTPQNVIRDLLNTMRPAAERLERGDDPDDVVEFLTFAAESYSAVRHVSVEDFGAPVTVAPDYD